MHETDTMKSSELEVCFGKQNGVKKKGKNDDETRHSTRSWPNREQTRATPLPSQWCSSGPFLVKLGSVYIYIYIHRGRRDFDRKK